MDNEPASKSSSSAGWAALLLMLPVTYVLSIGPVVFACEKWHLNPAPTGMLAMFYAPLGWLADKTPLKRPLMDYMQWWFYLGQRP